MFRNWEKKDDLRLIELYPTLKNKDIAKILNRTTSSVVARAFKVGVKKPKSFFLNIDNSGKFKKGHTSWNKGKDMDEYLSDDAINRIKKGQFKKGRLPHNTKSDFDISIRTHKGIDYQYIRLSLSNWELLHRYNWIKIHGDIEEGMNIIFKDGNQMNCDVNNLDKISDKELMTRNSISRFPKEVISAIKTLSKLKKVIKNA